MSSDLVGEIRGALTELVSAFGNDDTEAYFRAFAPDAIFVFYTEPSVLVGRDQWRALWDQWHRDGFRVLSCESSNVQVAITEPNMGFIVHEVHTEVLMDGEKNLLHERETIVFRREDDGRWRAVHEHLSPLP
jgi:uncharacterized protein (TIGR02246 family)